MVKPEQAMYHAKAALNVAVRTWPLARTTQYHLRKISRDGCWHSHNWTLIERELERRYAEQAAHAAAQVPYNRSAAR